MRFENEAYCELRKNLPKLNSQIEYNGNRYRISSMNVLQKQAKLENREETLFVSFDELFPARKAEHESTRKASRMKMDQPSIWSRPRSAILSEISPRQKEALENADVIACEDTRNSGLLLKSIGIHKPLIAHHEYNAHTSSTGILKLLEEGKKVAVICRCRLSAHFGSGQ